MNLKKLNVVVAVSAVVEINYNVLYSIQTPIIYVSVIFVLLFLI